MKHFILVLGLTLASLLVALSSISSDGRIRVNNNGNQNDDRKTEPPKRVYDIYGKRIRPNEKYIAELTLKNGRIIAYRRNKREIAALVKALKADGVTDEKLLDPQAWLMIICWKSVSSNCQGGCSLGTTCRGSEALEKEKGGPHFTPRQLCYCVP